MGVTVSPPFKLRVSARTAATIAAGGTWVPNIHFTHGPPLTGIAAQPGAVMPPSALKHLRWDYHPASGKLYVCGGDFGAPPYGPLQGDYNGIIFTYSGNGQWARDYPHLADGTPLYDCSAGIAGEVQPEPHCEAIWNYAGGNKFLNTARRADGVGGAWPAGRLPIPPNRPQGYSTLDATHTMEYDVSTRRWAVRADIPYKGNTFAEMGAYDAANGRIIVSRGGGGEMISTLNIATGVWTDYSMTWPNHPADGRTPTYYGVYRPVVVGSKVFWYNSIADPAPRTHTWPTYIFYCNLADIGSPAVRVPMYWFASLWPDANPSIYVSEQDMLYVPPENALLVFGMPRWLNQGAGFGLVPQSNPESYFVDVNSGAARPGPPLPRARNGAPYHPNNVLYHPPTQEIIAIGTTAFQDFAIEPEEYTSAHGTKVYTIYKRGANLPSWAAALPLYQWYGIPNTSIRSADPAVRPRPDITQVGPYAKVDAWNSFALRKRGSYLYSAANGGHGDYAGNEVNVICLNSEKPQWYELRTCTTTGAVPNVSHYLDGRPVSRHTYMTPHYVEALNRIFLIGCESGWQNSITHRKTDAFWLEGNDWDAAGTWPDHPTSGTVSTGIVMAQHPGTDDVYICFPGGHFVKFSAATGTYMSIPNGNLNATEGAVTIDPVRNRMVWLSSGTGYGGRHTIIDLARGVGAAIALTGPAASLVDSGSGQNSHGLIYEPHQDCYIAKPVNHATRLIRIDPTTWYCEEISTTLHPGSAAPSIPHTGTIYHRFRYIPEMRGIAYMPEGYADARGWMYFMRTA